MPLKPITPRKRARQMGMLFRQGTKDPKGDEDNYPILKHPEPLLEVTGIQHAQMEEPRPNAVSTRALSSRKERDIYGNVKTVFHDAYLLKDRRRKEGKFEDRGKNQ